MEDVLVIGSGGREHAIAWKLAQSPYVQKIYCAPGNGGTAVENKCENVKISGIENLVNFAYEKGIDLTVVGPEQPLVDGIADSFSKKGLRIFGPGKAAAKLEASKVYAKNFMYEHGVQTAPFNSYSDSNEDVFQAVHNVRGSDRVYVKADGLAAGKGALPGRTKEEAVRAVQRILVEKEFGDAGKNIVVESMLTGEEASYMALINSDSGIAAPLVASKDHKKLNDGDEGPNTGGMGAYAPADFVTKVAESRIHDLILSRTIQGLKKSGISYKGLLYPGLMMCESIDGPVPHVLEYNVRFGDPETQAVLPLLRSDFYEVLNDVIDGRKPDLRWRRGYAVCVVFASRGYPSNPEKGKLIGGLDTKRNSAEVFHAGTIYEGERFYTNGGRVLGVTCFGRSLEIARERAYEAVERISFEGVHFRKDIGKI